MRSEQGAARMLIIVGLAAVLVGGAAVGLRLLGPKGVKAPPKPNVAVQSLGSFIINLDPSDGFRYLKLTAAVRVESPLAGERLKEAMAHETYRWSDTLVKTVTNQTYASLRSEEGRARLQAELVRSLNEADGEEVTVVAVYFSEFVAQ